MVNYKSKLTILLFFIGMTFMTIIIIETILLFLENRIETSNFLIYIIVELISIFIIIKIHDEIGTNWESIKTVSLLKNVRLYQQSKKRKYEYKNKILTDDFEENPIEFSEYASTISDFIKLSKPNFSVGIFGDWGTGKTTLMKLIEKELQKGEKLSWNEVIARDEEAINQLKNFLKKRLINIDWIDEIFRPIIKKNKIIFDQNTIIIDKYKKSIQERHSNLENRSSFEAKLINLKTRFTLFFYNIYLFFYSRYLSSKNYVSSETNKISLKLKNNIIVYSNNGILFDIKTEKENGQVFLILKEKEVISVWFNAWRYEREEHLASIALMKKIGYSLSDMVIYKDIKKILLRGLIIIGKDIIRQIAINYGNLSEKGMEDLEKKIMPKADMLSQLDKDTLYFDGLERISKEMRQISKHYVIVVLIDDLDRCAPNKSLEILESIKIFFDMLGFVFVVGLSNKKVEKLITTEFEKSGITGKDYLEKIIQIQISIPNWTPKSISYLIDKFIDGNLLSKPYDTIMNDNKEQIAQSIKLTPRDLKIFINNFIFILETYFLRKSSIKWNENINDNTEFFNFIKEELNLPWISDKNCNMLEYKEIITLKNINKQINSLLNGIEINELLIYRIFNYENNYDVIYSIIFPLRHQIFLIKNNQILFEFYIFEKSDSRYIYSKNEASDLLIILSFQQRWNDCFFHMQNPLVRENLKNLCIMEKEKRDGNIDFIIKENKLRILNDILKTNRDSLQFWSFLEQHKDIIFKYRNWNEYIMVIESIQKPLEKSEREQKFEYRYDIPAKIQKKVQNNYYYNNDLNLTGTFCSNCGIPIAKNFSESNPINEILPRFCKNCGYLLKDTKSTENNQK